MLEQLLHDLNSRDGKLRQKAIREARALPSDELFRLVQLEHDLHQKSPRRAIVPTALLIVLLCVLGNRTTGDPLFLMAIFLALLGGGWTWLLNQSPMRARTSLAAAFAEVEDPRFIRILLVLLDTSRNDEQGTRYLVKALQKQLPGLRADQGHCLSLSEHRVLVSLLDTRFGERELMLVVLKALEQIGYPEAIPAVQTFAIRLGERLLRYRRQDRELQQAAEECLLFLRQRNVQIQQAQTLLRPSDASAHAPETLLRPAPTRADGIVPQELLRPAPSRKRIRTIIRSEHKG